MVIGLFLKNYKVYNGLKFIPLSNGTYFSALFGPNGVGKSSVLEALDTFFNDREWNIFKGNTGYMNTSYIVPVFLIKKEELKKTGKQNQEYYNLIKKISDYTWALENLHGSSTEATSFIGFKEELKTNIDIQQYFLFPLGIMYGSKSPYFGSFQRDENFLQIFGIEKQQIDNQTERTKFEDESIGKYFQNNSLFLDFVRENFYYAYIPTETNISQYTKLETRNMQMFMHKDVGEEISKAIGFKNLNSINNHLKDFVEEISTKLENYTYKKPIGGKSNLTMQDLIDTIIIAFFSIRVLTTKKGNISIDQMSSGEKRKALIDVAFAFLDSQHQQNKKIILAIDEPEISLHISACFEQFEKLKNISKNNHQVMITTHWYGFLPIIYNGLGINIVRNEAERDSLIQYYDLSKYQEEIRLARNKQKLPYDVKLKGKYDLIQSVISSLNSDIPYNYIFVEGSSDKIYLEYYLSDFIESKNLRIIPVGGAKEVINIVRNINLSITESDACVNGKVLGITDTDEQLIRVEDFKDLNNVKLKRLQFDKKTKDIKLINIDSNPVSPATDIEDALDPVLFWKILKSFITTDDKNYSFILDSESNEEAKCSYNVIDYTESQREKIREFFKSDNNKRKVDFANKYISTKIDKVELNIVKEILRLFNW